MERMLNADFSRYAELSGLPARIVVRQAFRNALPSVMTIVSVLYGFLIGGAVLVEIVFSWGGAGNTRCRECSIPTSIRSWAS